MDAQYWLEILRDIDGLTGDQWQDTEYIAQRIYAHADGQGRYMTEAQCDSWAESVVLLAAHEVTGSQLL